MEDNSEREHKKSLGAKIHYFFVNTHSLNQWVICGPPEFFPARCLTAENIKPYFLSYANKTNIFVARKILFIAENSPPIILKKSYASLP